MIQSHTIQITSKILSFIASIDEFKSAWRALGTLAPDRLSALRQPITVYLLAIRHYRQLSFDFEGFWQANREEPV